MRLKRMKHPELSGDKKYNFLLPIGSTEQHGPFAPFGTDTYINDYLVDQLEKKFPELIILPTLEFSRSQEHAGFFGTIYLDEETLEKVIFDICNSIYKKANVIFIASFHRNDKIINKVIKEKTDFFRPAKLIYLEVRTEENKKMIQQFLDGPLDKHAGNTEISDMLVIDKSTVIMPPKDYKKNFIEDPFGTDNLAEKSSDGIADNHPNWIINKKVGQKSLDLYLEKMVRDVKEHIG